MGLFSDKTKNVSLNNGFNVMPYSYTNDQMEDRGPKADGPRWAKILVNVITVLLVIGGIAFFLIKFGVI